MTEVSALEQQLKDTKQLVADAETAKRLYKNRDFKSLIVDRFCGDECARYAQASGDPALTAEQRADALAMAQAAGHLRRFLSIVVQMGNAAGGQIEDIEQMIAEARAEEDLEDDATEGAE